MKNGGGPACLRLRVVLNQAQIDSIQPRVILDNELYTDLVDWVNSHYRDQLSFEDLRDPNLLDELKAAAIALEPILQMQDLYKIV
jgi:succinylarginine dihydrolase